MKNGSKLNSHLKSVFKGIKCIHSPKSFILNNLIYDAIYLAQYKFIYTIKKIMSEKCW